MQATDWIPFSAQTPAPGDRIIACNNQSTEFWAGVWVDESDDWEKANTFRNEHQLILSPPVPVKPMLPNPYLICRGDKIVRSSEITHWQKLVPPSKD